MDNKKIYKLELKGCFWCPNFEKIYKGTDNISGYCNALTTNETKFIKKNEMRDDEHPQNPYYKFPKWCPLESK